MSLRKRTQTKHRPSYTSNYTCCSEDTILENKYFFGNYISRCELWRTLLFAYPLCHCNEWTSPVCDHSLIRLSMSGQDRTGSLIGIAWLISTEGDIRKTRRFNCCWFFEGPLRHLQRYTHIAFYDPHLFHPDNVIVDNDLSFVRRFVSFCIR